MYGFPWMISGKTTTEKIILEFLVFFFFFWDRNHAENKFTVEFMITRVVMGEKFILSTWVSTFLYDGLVSGIRVNMN